MEQGEERRHCSWALVCAQKVCDGHGKGRELRMYKANKTHIQMLKGAVKQVVHGPKALGTTQEGGKDRLRCASVVDRQLAGH